MRIERLTLENFGTFVAASWRFPPSGLVAFVGPNGSGKTTVLRAMQFAVTGACAGSSRKTDEATDWVDASSPSSVEVVFSHQGVGYRVVRSVRGRRSQLWLHDVHDDVSTDSIAVGDRDVTAAVAAALGDQYATVRDLCFVRQGQMTSVLDDSDSVRVRLLESLCGGARADKVHRVLGEAIADVVVPDVSAALALAERRVDQLAVDAKVEDETALTAQKVSDADYRESLDALRRHEAAEAAVELRRRQLGRIEDAVLEVRYAAALRRRRFRESLAARKSRATLGCDEAEAEAARAERWRLSLVVSSCGDGVASCPVCGAATPSLPDRVAAARRELAAMDVLAAKLRDADAACAVTASAASASRVGYFAARDDLRRRRDDLTALDVAVGLLSADQLSRHYGLVGEYQDAARAVRDALARRERIAREMEQARSDLEDLQARAARSRSVQAAVGRLKDVRSVFHRDNAPRIAAGRALAALEERCNGLLSMLDAGQVVKVRDDLMFDVYDDLGRARSAARLSGGQKVVLSLALRIGLNSVFAADVGFIAMDEPTYFLDRKSLAALRGVFEHLKQSSESEGLQCFVVTHEDGILGVFDKVYSVNGIL